MNKQEANKILNELYSLYGNDDFITLYYNNRGSKNLKWCDSINDAIDELYNVPDGSDIAIHSDSEDIFIENITDLDKALKELDQ